MANKESLATFRLALDLVKARGIASETRDRVATAGPTRQRKKRKRQCR